MSATARPFRSRTKRAPAIDLRLHFGKGRRGIRQMVEMAHCRERGAQESVHIAGPACPCATAIVASEFRIGNGTLGPGTCRIVEEGDTGRYGRPAPGGLLLVLHREVETMPSKDADDGGD